MRARSVSPKSYYGCEVCQIKYNGQGKCIEASWSKPPKSGKPLTRKSKIKLIDLCDDEKKKIVQLIEELSKSEEENRQLELRNRNLEETKNEIEEHYNKSIQVHLAEKDDIIKEMETYKGHIELMETEIKQKCSDWEAQKQLMDTQVHYFIKTLKKMTEEKNYFQQEVSRLKMCIKQSLDAFDGLREEIKTMHLPIEKRCREDAKCQTEDKKPPTMMESPIRENILHSRGNKEKEKLKVNMEQPLLPRGSSTESNASSKKSHFQDRVAQLVRQEVDRILMQKLSNPNTMSKSCNDLIQSKLSNTPQKGSAIVAQEELAKPFSKCCKTSSQAERILEKIGKPFSVVQNSPDRESDLFFVKVDTCLTHGNDIDGNEKTSRYLDRESLSERRLLKDLFYMETTFENLHN